MQISPGFKFSLLIFSHTLFLRVIMNYGFNFIYRSIMVVRILWITTVQAVMNRSPKVIKAKYLLSSMSQRETENIWKNENGSINWSLKRSLNLFIGMFNAFMSNFWEKCSAFFWTKCYKGWDMGAFSLKKSYFSLS